MLRWVENPYWQHFCGEKWFQHTLPIDPSSMTRWRKKIGEKGAESLLAQSIAAGLKTETIKPARLDKVNVDTTVQEKAVAFPTDARLYYKMREKLVALAEHHGLKLRQSYRRVARKALILVGRYGRAGQRKLLRRETRRLKGYLRKLAADLMRKKEDQRLIFVLWRWRGVGVMAQAARRERLGWPARSRSKLDFEAKEAFSAPTILVLFKIN